MDHYESLRERALEARPDGHRLGPAVLLREGVAGWMAAWRQRAPAALEPAAASHEGPAGALGSEVVEVLAAMALAGAEGA